MTQGQSLGEDGVTVFELLTAMAISAVVLALVGGTIARALEYQRRDASQVAVLNDAKRALERTTRDIRAADPVYVAAPDRIQLVAADRSGSRRTVTYERVNGSLVFTDGSTGRSNVLVAGLLATQSLFRYHLDDGSTVAGATVSDPSLVRAVTFRLTVVPSGTGKVIDLENRVLVRNAYA